MWLIKLPITLLMASMLILISACGSSNENTVLPLPDITAPIITLNGHSTINLILDENYSEQGAIATDENDGNLEVSISGQVNSSSIGRYTITYTATDNAGNISSVSRLIIVSKTRAFITTWKTDVSNAFSQANQILISTKGAGYDYQVDWGDGTTDEHVTGDIIHAYALPGTYTVAISGNFPRLYFEPLNIIVEDLVVYHSDHNKLRSLEQWGDIKWQSMQRAFADCHYLVSNATDAPDLSSVTDMSEMFSWAWSFNQDISHWDVSNITNMHGIFANATAFNQDLSTWDVSQVTNMSKMFSNARDFNQPLNQWDVSAVTDMSHMFSNAIAFNQDLSQWDVSGVNNMARMFNYARVFNQAISNWDVSNVTNMNAMFSLANAFNQDLSNWDTSQVISMSSMFASASAFNRDISNWNVSQVSDMSWMFSSADSFNQDLSNWDVSQVASTSSMFNNASSFDQDISAWNISAVKEMSNMFANAKLSTVNYDALLMGWSQQALQANVEFSAGNSTYSSFSQSFRDILTESLGWLIQDGGSIEQNPPP
ncbi:BspA family leucine-rich repeat surface protein [Thalassomonas sp. RHCl1]|uniref:BspA family leucine-rich repeat surface protein n=1 Tax=Thalassomonas sp. RHCl1 TaxID=2995320 RepID=UPI00248D3901|nr:BspA family leucine-rich repeat surface protein [Thalassomonas sp. RHCl1]